MRFLLLCALLALIALRIDWGRAPDDPTPPNTPTPPTPRVPDMRPCPLCGHGMDWTGYGSWCQRCEYYIREPRR